MMQEHGGWVEKLQIIRPVAPWHGAVEQNLHNADGQQLLQCSMCP